MAENPEYEWIEKIRARGWGDVFSTALDILEPLGPLGAQLLWVAQPAAHWIGGWGTLSANWRRRSKHPTESNGCANCWSETIAIQRRQDVSAHSGAPATAPLDNQVRGSGIG